MIIIDVNLLLYAINEGSPHRVRARKWLERTFAGTEAIAMPWLVVLGFLRISTNARVFATPLRAEEAIAIVDGWFAQPNVARLEPGPRHWRVLRGLLAGTGVAGNLASDAHLAAISIEHDCELCSADTDFARFPGLKYTNPLRA
jgi:hypothetical protein